MSIGKTSKTEPFKGLSFTNKEANKMKEARNILLGLCKEEYNNWDLLPKVSKETKMYLKAKELDIDWNCIFIYEYERRGMIK